jgi:RNA polymerase subunit RPABC4/transcription elongation factor Spt4
VSAIDERIATLKEARESLEAKRLEAFTELGEKAFQKVRDVPEFAEITAVIEDAEKRIEEIGEEEAALVSEQEKQEREERERIAKQTCPSCKTVNPDDAAFCENCGAKLGELPKEFCKNCGIINQPGQKFCGECGTKLEE